MFVLARRLEVGEEGVAVDGTHLPKKSVPTGGFSKTTKFGPGPSPPISAITRWRDAQCPARTWHHAAIAGISTHRQSSQFHRLYDLFGPGNGAHILSFQGH